jgi:polyphosphate kinase 2
MITKSYLQFVNEELRIGKIDETSLSKLKENLLIKLREYKTYILSNVVYNLKTNKIEYKDFDTIDIPVIMRELDNEFTDEFIDELNIEQLLVKINQILELKERSTKKKIREEFENYFKSLDDRIKSLRGELSFGEHEDTEGEDSIISKKQYEAEKFQIQVELLKLQEWVIKHKKKLVIVFEGRDAAGKGSTIKRFTEYLNPRAFRVVALGLPTKEEKANWFQRYEKLLPKEGEIVFFDRSWYNRAVVEPALGYCTEEEYDDFMNKVVDWEEDLIMNQDMILVKFWFSITKEKQLSRFEHRKNSPLKYWKFSSNDEKVVDKWDIIGNYKNQMFTKTSSDLAPWVIVSANDKNIGRLNAMRYVLSVIKYTGKDQNICKWYPEVVTIIK